MFNLDLSVMYELYKNVIFVTVKSIYDLGGLLTVCAAAKVSAFSHSSSFSFEFTAKLMLREPFLLKRKLCEQPESGVRETLYPASCTAPTGSES